ncbi:MAG: hypothetical protein ABEJ69_03575, partial [Candidatus Nanohaloarchaea archaeon]
MQVSGELDVTRAVKENKETIITASLLLYIGAYLLVGMGGITFQAQPAAACTYDYQCSGNSCSQTYNDYCDGSKLVEYDNDCTKDSTTVTDSCSNTCSGGSCTDCSTDCSAPSTTKHECGVCNG